MSSEDIVFEDYVFFYNFVKFCFDVEDYLVIIFYEFKKGLLCEFLVYFVEIFNEVVIEGLSDFMDFFIDDSIEEFGFFWDMDVFENGRVELKEIEFYVYLRYWDKVWNDVSIGIIWKMKLG